MRIAALVVGHGPARAGVERQRPPAERLIDHPGPWADAIAAAGCDHDWLWLVRGDTRPAPDALAALVAAADAGDGLPAPVLLASKVVSSSGGLDLGSTPWPPLYDRTAAMAAAEHHLAAVRIARWGSLLVRADAIARHGGPRAGLGDAADLEWTARLLREQPGYVVPASVAVREGARPAGRARALAGTLNALASREAWGPNERLWVVYTALTERSRGLVDGVER